jgi:mannitol-specific phosphotransferase system IIBC component
MTLQKPKKSRSQSFWPILGLLLIIACAIMAYFIGPAVVDWLDDGNVIRGFPPRGIPRENVNWILRGILFVVLGLLSSLVVAAAVPKKKNVVNEKKLIKERQEMVNEKKARKLRQQQMNKLNKGR